MMRRLIPIIFAFILFSACAGMQPEPARQLTLEETLRLAEKAGAGKKISDLSQETNIQDTDEVIIRRASNNYRAQVQYLPSANPSDQFNKIKNAYYVSTNASVTDHADTAQSGSIADIITNEMSGAQGDIILPGNKTYQIKQALTISATARLMPQKGAIIDTDISIRDASYKWTLSGSGTNEYYLEVAAGGNPNINEPDDVAENDSLMTEAIAGSLSAGEWDWGNNDTLGFNTVYVRLSDSTDPDGKASDYVEAGYTLTINGPFNVGLFKTFGGNGRVIFGNSAIKNIFAELWGAIVDSGNDDAAPLQAAATCASASGITLSGLTGTYETSVGLDFGNIPRIEMGKSLIKQADSSNQAVLVDLTTAISSGVWFWELNVDGNMANNTAVLGVRIRDTQSAMLTTKINATLCDTGIEISGNTEMGKHYLGVKSCTLGVLEAIAAALTPDENQIFLTGGGCETFYKKTSHSTSSIHLDCEGGSNTYAVVLDDSKHTRLTGMVRGCDGGGIKIDSPAAQVTLDMVIFDSGTVAGSEYGLLVEDAESLNGHIEIQYPKSNGVWIKQSSETNLDIYVVSADGTGITLGSATTSLGRPNIRCYSIATGVALNLRNMDQGKVEIVGYVDDITIHVDSVDSLIMMPAGLYDKVITNGGTRTIVEYTGIMDTTNRDAIPSPFEGMRIQANRWTDMLPNVYMNGAWRVLAPSGVHTGDGETVTVAAPTLLTYGYSKLDSNVNTITATLPDGTFTGQIKVIVMSNSTNASTVSIAHHQTSDPEVATFDAVDETGVFMWTGTEWITIFATCTFL